MTFRRSLAGISSEYLFYRVDFVAYCEGIPEVHGPTESLDVLYWQKVFNEYCRKDVYCKSYGSKLELSEIAERVAKNQIANTIVIFDRDYDDIWGLMKCHKRIIYTFGYSWESDAMSSFKFEDVFPLFSPTPRLAPIKRELKSYVRLLDTTIRRCALLDAKYYFAGCALFDRKKPQSIVKTIGDKGPDIDRKRLVESARRMGRANVAGMRRHFLIGLDGWRRFFGKTVARLMYQWFVFRSSKLRIRQKISYGAFMAAVITSIEWTAFPTLPALNHVRSSIDRAVT